MSKYETGVHKGEEIMIECDKDRAWTDHSNNVFVNREYDKNWNCINTLRVSERLRGNVFAKWATGMSFEDAVKLAERLVVGKEYLPPKEYRIFRD